MAGAAAADALRRLCAGHGYGDVGHRAAAVAEFALQRCARIAHLRAAVPVDRHRLADGPSARPWRRRRCAAAVGDGGGGAAGHECLGPIRVSRSGAPARGGGPDRHRGHRRGPGAVAALRAAFGAGGVRRDGRRLRLLRLAGGARRAARGQRRSPVRLRRLCHLPAAVHAVRAATAGDGGLRDGLLRRGARHDRRHDAAGGEPDPRAPAQRSRTGAPHRRRGLAAPGEQHAGGACGRAHARAARSGGRPRKLQSQCLARPARPAGRSQRPGAAGLDGTAGRRQGAGAQLPGHDPGAGRTDDRHGAGPAAAVTRGR